MSPSADLGVFIPNQTAASPKWRTETHVHDSGDKECGGSDSQVPAVQRGKI